MVRDVAMGWKSNRTAHHVDQGKGALPPLKEIVPGVQEWVLKGTIDDKGLGYDI